MSSYWILAAIIGLLIGAAAVYVFLRTGFQAATSAIQDQLRKLEEDKKLVDQNVMRLLPLEGEVGALRDALESRKQEIATLENQRREAESKIQELLPIEGEANGLKDALSQRLKEITSIRSELEILRASLDTEKESHRKLKSTLEEREGRIDEQIKGLDAERKRFLEEKKQLEDSFANLSKQALAAAQQSFVEMANEKFKDARQVSQEEIDKVLAPMRQTLTQLQEHTREIEQKRTESYAELSLRVRELLSSTSQLSNALRRPEVRGSWGELTLKRAAEAAGLVEGTDFEMQVSTSTDDGKLRPDMVVRLPNDRVIIVDSKVPLDAYLKSISEEDEASKRLMLREHANQVRKHIQQLSSKSYQNLHAASADFVVMFVPSEALYQGAIQEDPTLLEEAFNKKVILANPMTLVALLRTIASGMQQQKAYENALQIAKLGGELNDAVAVFAEHYIGVGSSIKQAADRYNKSVGSLERNILSKSRRLKELGAKATKEIDEVQVLEATIRPQAITEKAEGQDSSTLF